METGTGAGTGRERGRGRGWRPVDEYRMRAETRAETRKGVETCRRSQDGNGDGSAKGAGTRTGTGVEIRRRTQDGSGDGNRGGDP